MAAQEHLAWGRSLVARREAARRAAWERAAARQAGVSWSGCGPGPFPARSADALEREAQRWASRRQARLAREPEPRP